MLRCALRTAQGSRSFARSLPDCGRNSLTFVFAFTFLGWGRFRAIGASSLQFARCKWSWFWGSSPLRGFLLLAQIPVSGIWLSIAVGSINAYSTAHRSVNIEPRYIILLISRPAESRMTPKLWRRTPAEQMKSRRRPGRRLRPALLRHSPCHSASSWRNSRAASPPANSTAGENLSETV